MRHAIRHLENELRWNQDAVQRLRGQLADPASAEFHPIVRQQLVALEAEGAELAEAIAMLREASESW